MNILGPSAISCGWKKSVLWLILAIACFHGAYSSIKYPAAGLFMFGYAFFLLRLADQPTVRRAFYFGLAAGFLCYAPQLFFFWTIFKEAAIVLWLILAFWIGLFTAIVCACVRRWGKLNVTWFIPIVWTGLEYFRSELYYLKFSWLNIGYALHFSSLGMYGSGFLVFVTILAVCRLREKQVCSMDWLFIAIALFAIVTLLPSVLSKAKRRGPTPVPIVGVQLEFPPTGILTKVLNQALAKHPDGQIFVLSEYTLEGAVPDSLRNWCRDHDRFLVVGGKDVVTNHIYYNTAFVVGTNGDTVFKQAKRTPIQFFDDGLPAPNQQVWNSPWGNIGICICYDLSYTRVTDELVRQGAHLLIVPTMDVTEWGRHQHELHSRVAPVRAAEYGIPIFRLASSGISQAVDGQGNVVAQTAFGKEDEILYAQLRVPSYNHLPPDRLLAPICTGLAAILIIILTALNWGDQRMAGQST
jgi:apolipoprotein N-acyltransferase